MPAEPEEEDEEEAGKDQELPHVVQAARVHVLRVREQEGVASWVTGVAGNDNEEDKRLLNSVFPPLDDVGVGCGALESVKFEQMTQAETLMRGTLDAVIDHVGSGKYISDEDTDQTRTLMREILRQENCDATDSVIKTILHDVADLGTNALLSERGESVSGVSKEAELERQQHAEDSLGLFAIV